MRKTECCSVGFFTFSFLLLHTNKHHLIMKEMRWTSNVPDFEKTKITVALCYLLPVSSASVRFASSALSFAFSIFLRSLSYFLRSPLCCPLTFSLMSLLLLCFLSLSFSNLSLCFGFSSGFYSQRTQAFLGNGRRASWWRETCPPPQTETAPLMAFIYCQNHRA